MLMPPQNQTPYNFILDPSSQNRGGSALLQNPKQKRIILVVFVVFVAIIVFILGNLLLSGGKQSNNDLADIAAYQTEIARITDLSYKDITDPNTKNTVATLQSFIGSDLTDSTAYLTKFGPKLSPAKATLRKDDSIDKALLSASKSSSYDTVLIKRLATLQDKYKSSLQNALNNSPAKNKKNLLEIAAQNIITFEGVSL